MMQEIYRALPAIDLVLDLTAISDPSALVGFS